MPSIPIDHLGRDDLVTLLYRVAARLAIVTGDHHPTGIPQVAPTGCGTGNTEPHHGFGWTPMAANRYQIPRYEKEHDPWNAHLRSANSASSSGTIYHTAQPVAQMQPYPSRGHLAPGDAATATRHSDVMTCRYSQVDMQTTVHNRYRPEHATEAMVDQEGTAATFERSLPNCANTCKYCSSVCCLRKKGHTVHLCLIHKIP